MNYFKYLVMAAVCLALPACNGLNCGSEGGDPGETLKAYETDEHVFFIDRDLCQPGAVVAKSRSGSAIDFCAEIDRAEKMIAIPPKVALDVMAHKDHVDAKAIVRAQGGSAKDIENAGKSERNFKMRGSSAYWAANRREEYFLKRYREGIPYPAPDTKAADDELFMGELLEKNLGIK